MSPCRCGSKKDAINYDSNRYMCPPCRCAAVVLIKRCAAVVQILVVSRVPVVVSNRFVVMAFNSGIAQRDGLYGVVRVRRSRVSQTSGTIYRSPS